MVYRSSIFSRGENATRVKNSVAKLIALGSMVVLSACSTQYSASRAAENFEFPSDVNDWFAPVSSRQKQLHLTAVLGVDTRAYITFTESNPKKKPHVKELFYLEFSDKDCSGGHRVRISYYESENILRSVYFDELVPWGKSVQVDIAWQDPNTVRATVNKETKEISLEKTNFRFLTITSGPKPIHIESISFNQQEPE